MKELTVQYILVFTFGFGLWQTWWLVIVQANYWNYFYGKFTLTVFFLIQNAACLINSFIIERWQRCMSTRGIAVQFVVVNVIFAFTTYPLKSIQNNVLRLVVTAASFSAVSFSCAAMGSAMFSCTARLQAVLSQAQILGAGSANLCLQFYEDLVTHILSDGKSKYEYERSLSSNFVVVAVTSALIVALTFFAFVAVYGKFTWAFQKTQAADEQNRKENIALQQKANEMKQTEMKTTAENQDNLQGDVTIVDVQKPKPTIMRRILFLSASVMTDRFVGAIMHPLFTLSIPSQAAIAKYNTATSDEWRLTLLTVCNICDFIARVLPAFKWIMNIVSARSIGWIAISRAIGSMMFFLMNLPAPSLDVNNIHPIIFNDTVAMIAVGLNQFLGLFIYAGTWVSYQSLLDTKEERARGSFILNKFLQIGSVAGSVASIVFIQVFKK